MQAELLLYLMIWNGFVFMLFGIDKRKARLHKRRISEETLIFSAFFMGALGGLLGMGVFHHKTKHMKFRILLPIAFIFNIGVITFAKWVIQTF